MLTKPCYHDSSQQMLHILTTMKNPNFERCFCMCFVTTAVVPMLLKTVTARATKSWVIFVPGKHNLVVSVKILRCWFPLSLIKNPQNYYDNCFPSPPFKSETSCLSLSSNLKQILFCL